MFIISDMDDKEQLQQQRQQLNKRLGLDMAGGLGLDSRNLFNDEDLCLDLSTSCPGSNNNSKVNKSLHGIPLFLVNIRLYFTLCL